MVHIRSTRRMHQVKKVHSMSAKTIHKVNKKVQTTSTTGVNLDHVRLDGPVAHQALGDGKSGRAREGRIGVLVLVLDRVDQNGLLVDGQDGVGRHGDPVILNRFLISGVFSWFCLVGFGVCGGRGRKGRGKKKE